jgi:hypothetical protein
MVLKFLIARAAALLAAAFLAGTAMAAGLPPGSVVNVLWVGNSLTNTAPDYDNYALGPMPERLKPMLAEFGITMNYTARIQGGAEFSDHIKNSATMAELAKTSYDIVNLQGYYEGFSSALAYQTAVKPLYDIAHAAGSDVLFEEVWWYRGDSGSPQFPTASNAVEAATKNLPGSYAVQVARVWNAVFLANPALLEQLRYDGTHQNKFGEYLNALTYARFFSGKSVQAVASIPPSVRDGLTAAQLQVLKTAVDTGVTIFYQAPGMVPKTTLTVTGINEGQAFASGSTISLSAVAQNTVTGDISAKVEWRNELNALLGQGATLMLAAPAVGNHTITAKVTGPNGVSVEIARHFTVTASPVSGAPVAHDKPVSLARYTNFRQVNLTASAEAMGNPVAWATLQLDKTQFKGQSAVINGMSPSTVDLNYANGYVGQDVVRWRVQDSVGHWSNWAGINITVTPGDAAGQTAVTVRARGNLARDVGPLMELRVNGEVVASAEVRATAYEDHRFTVPAIAAGAKVDVVFNNDLMSGGEDRNLYVESITLNGATIAANAAGVTFDRGAGALAFDGKDVLPGLRTLYWNGALRFTAGAPAASGFTATLGPVTHAGYNASYSLTTNQPARCRAAWLPGKTYAYLYDDIPGDAQGLVHTKLLTLAAPAGQTVYAVCRANGSGLEKEVVIQIR